MAETMCIKCGQAIADKRVRAILTATGQLPETCIRCSDMKKYVGIPVYKHKTGGTIVPIDPRNKEQLRQAQRFFRRGR